MNNRSNDEAQQQPQSYFFPSLRYLQNYVWPAASDSAMDAPQNDIERNDFQMQQQQQQQQQQRAMSEPALSEFGLWPTSFSQDRNAATYPAFATLLAAANSSGGRLPNDGFRYSLRDSRVASDEREIIPIDKHVGVAGKLSGVRIISATTDVYLLSVLTSTLQAVTERMSSTNSIACGTPRFRRRGVVWPP
jgi:type II secretory pathway pseudopilin PulG